jgi:YHS domain-containing protein
MRRRALTQEDRAAVACGGCISTLEADVSIRRHNHHRHGSAETVTDPVCGLRISKYGAAARREAGGTLYHFCSARCACAFDVDPARYTASTG